MILVVEHSVDWANSFEREANRIGLALGAIVVRIHHIGSTAISHTKAKPVIDMLLEITTLESLDQKNHLMEALGYEVKGEFGIADRRYFRMDDAIGKRTHQVHAFEAGVQNVVRHIAFRDYMRAHPSIAIEYGELKERLARENPNDMEAYVGGKDAFVKEHERRALLWRLNNNEQTSA
jgi:GrpB-like predicted nucleotidyltransferase (UPF0157 family)